MTTTLTYIGYTGNLSIDLEAAILFGRITDIIDVITFQGSSVEEARQAFHDSVDEYLAYCEELGQKPERPFSGKLLFRTTPERHHRIFVAASVQGKSVNAWIDDVLAQAAERVTQGPTASTDVAATQPVLSR